MKIVERKYRQGGVLQKIEERKSKRSEVQKQKIENALRAQNPPCEYILLHSSHNLYYSFERYVIHIVRIWVVSSEPFVPLQ